MQILLAVLAFSLGPPELMLLFLILVVLFGARRIPELGRSLGEGIKNFRGSVKEMTDDPSDPGKKSDS